MARAVVDGLRGLPIVYVPTPRWLNRNISRGEGRRVSLRVLRLCVRPSCLPFPDDRCLLFSFPRPERLRVIPVWPTSELADEFVAAHAGQRLERPDPVSVVLRNVVLDVLRQETH